MLSNERFPSAYVRNIDADSGRSRMPLDPPLESGAPGA
jgi:hypothetical protein